MKNLEFNKIAAAVLLAGVLAMASGTVAKLVFGGYSHHHEEKRGYQIEGAEVTGGATEQKEVDIGTALAAATVEQGANVAKKCATCHNFEKGGANMVGPNLWGVLGGKHAHMASFQYSSAMQATAGEVWTVENTWKFLNNPQAYIKGTKMSFAGLRKPEELAAIIVYLNSKTDKSVSFPAPKKVEEAPAAAEEAKATEAKK